MEEDDEHSFFDDMEEEEDEEFTIYDDIEDGDLEEVQERVLADAAVLDGRRSAHPVWRATPLMYAISCKKPAIALWLIEHRGHHDLESTDDGGSTALHIASMHGPLQATINAISQGPTTALSFAAYEYYQPIVQLLLDAGADPTIPAGRSSPLQYALDYGDDAVIALLRHSIAEPDRVRKCVAAVGKRGGLSEDLCSEISKYLLPAWATKGRHV